MIRPFFVCAFVLLSFSACERKVDPAVSSPFSGRTVELVLSGHRLQVEVADTPARQARGLMFRRELAENKGMIFVYSTPQQASFYMRDTYIPLSIAFIDRAGVILEIRDMEPLDETSVRSRSDAVLYAIEANQGWFAERGIGPGTRVLGLDRL